MKISFLLLQVLLICGITCNAQLKFLKTEIFPSKQSKKVHVFQTDDTKVLLFKTSLEVNTDGTPLSYSSEDIGGKTKALNNICNAVTIKRTGSKENLCYKEHSKALDVFREFKLNDYKPLRGYDIKWENVLNINRETGKPCVISIGKYKGYYSSDTSLKNGLKSGSSECDYENQISSVEVAGLVLPGGDNLFKKNGVSIGDLAFAYNPDTNTLIYAIIYDAGPRNKLGEGSVYLNSKLKNTKIPENYHDVKKLTTSSNTIVGFIAKSKNYHDQKPYNNQNISSRLDNWLSEIGYSKEKLIEFIKEQNLLNR